MGNFTSISNSRTRKKANRGWRRKIRRQVNTGKTEAHNRPRMKNKPKKGAGRFSVKAANKPFMSAPAFSLGGMINP